MTLVLKGHYTDRVTCVQCKWLQLDDKHDSTRCRSCQDRVTYAERMWPGKWAYRKAEHIHVVDVDPGGCWTLLYFFPPRRTWGFWVPRKLDGVLKFTKSNKYFFEHGHHPCDQP